MDTTFASMTLQPFDPATGAGLPSGEYRVTVFVDAIPSQSRLLLFNSDRIFANGVE